LFAHFVADAPHDDGGVVAVAADEGAGVGLGPIGEDAAVIVGGFGAAPGVEGFIEDDEAHLVGEFEKLRRGRIVAGADGVAAHVLEDFELALQRADVDGAAEGSEIVVIADAVHFDLFAVEEEAFGSEFDGADAEIGGVFVEGAPPAPPAVASRG
jgi:hypothetical protein